MSVKVIHLGEDRFNADWLKSVTERDAVRTLSNHSKNQVINAWKIANGYSIPNFDANEPVKKTVKRSKKKTSKD